MDKLLQELVKYYELWAASGRAGAEEAGVLLKGLNALENMREIRPFHPPVINKWLDKSLHTSTSEECKPLLIELGKVARQFKWLPSPVNYISQEFSEQFSYTQLIGHPYRNIESAFYESDKIALGFSLQAPHQFYPPHHHKAVEFYTPLTGTAVWQFGTKTPTTQPAGTRIFHQSDVPHAMQTYDEPLLCLWAWIGDLQSPPMIPSRSWL